MTNHWHEQIQRYVNGQANAAEAVALQAALSRDAKLRALYLDYVNLDVALAAVAEAGAITESEIAMTAASARGTARSSLHFGALLAATAACAALFTGALLIRHRNTAQQSNSDVAAACAATQEAITRLSVEPPALFPAWASPTAPMLDPPRTVNRNL